MAYSPRRSFHILFESARWPFLRLRLMVVAGRLPTPAIGDKAHQPSSFHFPQRVFGKTSMVKRSFQRQWFDRWSWLHYDEDRDLAFCFTCVVAYQSKHLQSTHSLEQTFISTGFSNWKDATAKFAKHEGSRCHKDSVLKTITLPATTTYVWYTEFKPYENINLIHATCKL